MSDAAGLPATGRDVISRIYRLFSVSNDWPTFEEIDYDVDRDRVGDAWTLLRDLPNETLTGTDLRTRPPDQQRIGLTIVGMAVAAEKSASAATDFRVFCSSVKIACQLVEGTRPPHSPSIVATELPRLIELPASGRPPLLVRVGRQWEVNGHLWRQMSDAGTDMWTAAVSRVGVRPFRDLQSPSAFPAAERARMWEVAAQRIGVHGAVRPSASGHGSVADSAVPTGPAHHAERSLPTWFGLLPQEMGEAIRSRLAGGHTEDAVVQSWKTLAESLSALSGLHLDGVDLVNQTFKSWDLAGMTATEKSDHQAHVDSMRGLARFRNVHAHPAAPELTDLDAAAFILMAGTCLERVRKLHAGAPPATP